MPRVKITKDYTFSGPDGKKLSLADLFDGRKQLVVYHFMLGPSATVGCPGCSFLVDELPSHPEHLKSRQTTLALVSRAPMEKIEAFQKRMGWEHFPWLSSYETDFNYDFHVTQDESVQPIYFNYMDKDTLKSKGLLHFISGEQPGFSVFIKDGDDIYHTYSTYARGSDHLSPTVALLDFTPLGRQDKDHEHGLFKYHDEYTDKDLEGGH
jgi:predicted dithiol-disulfide oxidoreductase (DUF899 family)